MIQKEQQKKSSINLGKVFFFRCYSERWHQRKPTYIDCSVSEEWHLLSNYKQWYEENYVEGWQLDKDLLFPRNKIYSKETCVFVPQPINTLLTFRTNDRGQLPLGVTVRSDGRLNPYSGQCCNRAGKQILKSFNNSTDAHFWYLEQKISMIDSYLNEDYNEKIKIGLRNWRVLLKEHLDNRVEFVA